MARQGRKDRGLVERPKGSRIWWVRLYHEGREHWFGPHENKTTARTFYENRKKEQKEERFDPDAFHKRNKKTLLSEVIDDHLKTYSGRDLNSQKNFGEWWKETLKGKKCDQVSTADLEKIRKQFAEEAFKKKNGEERKRTPGTINRYFAYLRHIYNIAIRDRKTDKNPVTQVKFFKEPKGKLRFLSDGEELKLKENMAPEDFALVAFAINTGLRRAEQFGLKWHHIDQENKVLTIPRSKSGETRHVPLNGKALEILKGLNSWMVSHWVFPSNNPAYSLDDHNFCGRIFANALKQAKVEGVVWHTLRHTFASRLAMAGVDIRTVQELMGHKDISVTMRYSHLSPGHLHNAVQKLVKTEPAQTEEKPENQFPTVTKTGKTEEEKIETTS